MKCKLLLFALLFAGTFAYAATEGQVYVKACAQARANLELLRSKFAVSVAGANGEATPLDDKGRQAQIADANAQIALYCK